MRSIGLTEQWVLLSKTYHNYIDFMPLQWRRGRGGGEGTPFFFGKFWLSFSPNWGEFNCNFLRILGKLEVYLSLFCRYLGNTFLSFWVNCQSSLFPKLRELLDFLFLIRKIWAISFSDFVKIWSNASRCAPIQSNWVPVRLRLVHTICDYFIDVIAKEIAKALLLLATNRGVFRISWVFLAAEFTIINLTYSSNRVNFIAFIDNQWIEEDVEKCSHIGRTDPVTYTITKPPM